MKKYVVRLNDKYMTEYDGKTGYNDFGDKSNAVKFDAVDEAMSALADVVWGGSDEPPEIDQVDGK